MCSQHLDGTMKQHAHVFLVFAFSTGVLSQNIPFGPVLFASKMPPAPLRTVVSSKWAKFKLSCFRTKVVGGQKCRPNVDIQVFLHNRIHMTVNKGKGLQSFLSQSLQNVVNTQSCMKKLIIYGESEKKNNNEKDPAINFCSYHPVFVPSPLFLPCFPVTPPIHLSTLLQYFPVCVCGENISVLDFGDRAPQSGTGCLGGAKLVRISSYIWSCQLTCQMPCRHMRRNV